MNLNDILNRRADLSTFLVHLTRGGGEQSASENLKSIISSSTIEARSPYGHLVDYIGKIKGRGDSQKVVCFTETPLEYTYLLTSEIEGRDFQFEPYGIAITKSQGRGRGINPVWYVDITPGHDWLTKQLDCIRKQYIKDPKSCEAFEALFPFFETMGNKKGEYCKEFWWEREWRHRGTFVLPNTIICFCPEGEIPVFKKLLKENKKIGQCIDPRWSLERIIAALAGFTRSETDIIRKA